MMNDINRRTSKQIEKQQEMANQIAENRRRRDQVQLESRDYLKQISENTKGISEVIDLVRKNNKINEDTFQLFQQVLTVIIAETPEQADGIIRNVMNKANQANEDWGTIQIILEYGKMLGKLTFPDSGLFD